MAKYSCVICLTKDDPPYANKVLLNITTHNRQNTQMAFFLVRRGKRKTTKSRQNLTFFSFEIFHFVLKYAGPLYIFF